VPQGALEASGKHMTYGLLAALSWGVSTLLAAVAARRIGTLRTVMLGEAAGLVGYLTLFYLGHFSLRGVGSTAWLLILAGVIAVGGYLALYRGLESGHVGLVSAVSACYGGVIAVTRARKWPTGGWTGYHRPDAAGSCRSS
jgi:uncharacterized membrane protein